MVQKFYVTIITLIIVLNSVQAQRQTYDSLYTIREGVVGHAIFQYKGGGIEKMTRDGEFKFDYENYSYNKNRLFYLAEHWKGEFKHDKKEGKWSYQYSNDVFFLNGVTERKLEYNTASKTANLKATYSKGIPKGDWEYLNMAITEDLNETILEDFQVSFSEGLLHGDVFCTMSDSMMTVIINGQADKGRFDGIWNFKYVDKLELREYDRGVLLNSTELTLEGDTIGYLEFPLSEQLKTLLSNPEAEMKSSGRTTFRDGYPRLSIYVTSQLDGNRYLNKMIALLLQNDREVLDGSYYPLGTYRHKYPYSNEEKRMLSEWDSLFTLYKMKLDIVRKEEILDLRYSDDFTTSLVLEWLKSEKVIIESLGKSTGLSGARKLEHTYREGMVTDSIKSLLSKSILVLDGQRVEIDYAKSYADEKNMISYLLYNFRDRIIVADSLHKQFIVKIKSMHLDNALLLKNDKISKLISRLDSSIISDEKDPSLNYLIKQVHDDYLAHIVDKEYQIFLSDVDNKEHQAILGDSILLELHSIEEIYELIHKIAERRRDIDERYTEYIFDPFTFTEKVPSRIKRRLYDLIAVQVFNQMVDLATASRDPFHCEKVLNELYEVQGAMYVLKDRDTKKLEGRLKRHKELSERLLIIAEELE